MIISRIMGDAINAVCPNATWALDEPFGYENLRWMDEVNAKPTKQEVMLKYEELLADFESNEYQRLRAAEYPSIQQQMDMQYHDALNGTTTWQDAINAVKAKYPKPEGV